MNSETNEEVLLGAIEALKKQLVLTSSNSFSPKIELNTKKYTLLFINNQKNIELAIELRNNLTLASLGSIFNHFKKSPNTILVSRYINPNIAQRLKDMGIQFLDTHGNAFIAESNFFLYINGGKIANKQDIITRPQYFSNAALTVIFLFLCRPEYLNLSYRTIAAETCLSLGTISQIFKQLIEMQFVVKKQDKWIFINIEQLIERWVRNYAEHLRPKLILGKYYADKTDWWKDADISQFNSYWGCEIAADKLTHLLKPSVITIYTNKNSSNLQLKYGFKNDPKGNIEILKSFWRFHKDDNNNELVPPLLIYADLISSGEPRNFEIAKIIYEKEFYRYLR